VEKGKPGETKKGNQQAKGLRDFRVDYRIWSEIIESFSHRKRFGTMVGIRVYG